MSVNIAVRLTFEKKAVHFDRGVFANVICLVLISDFLKKRSLFWSEIFKNFVSGF